VDGIVSLYAETMSPPLWQAVSSSQLSQLVLTHLLTHLTLILLIPFREERWQFIGTAVGFNK